MSAKHVRPLYSASFDELRGYFRSLTPPYNLEHIHGFNAIYRDIYPELSREERSRAEGYVDTLIEGLEDQELAEKIFGVV
jgi:hypothetical protein